MENEMENNIKEIACVGCLSKEKTFFSKKNGFSYYKCSRCHMVSLYMVPESYSVIYEAEYFKGGKNGFGYVSYDEDKESMRGSFVKYFGIIKKISNKTGRLFDVGAATGFFMLMAKEAGFDVSGIEISDYAAELGRSKGLDLKTGVLEDMSSVSDKYDVVTMLDVLEHMPKPEDGLNIVNKILKTGGLVVINTPDSGSLWAKIISKNWHLLVPPEHIHLFNKESVRKILERQGFEVLMVGHVGKKFSIEYIFIMYYKWFKMDLFKSVASKLKGTWLGKFSLPTDFRDNMFIVARKK